MKQLSYEILKWLPVISIFVNMWIARSTAKEIAKTGNSFRSFLKLLGWELMIVIIVLIAAS